MSDWAFLSSCFISFSADFLISICQAKLLLQVIKADGRLFALEYGYGQEVILPFF